MARKHVQDRKQPQRMTATQSGSRGVARKSRRGRLPKVKKLAQRGYRVGPVEPGDYDSIGPRSDLIKITRDGYKGYAVIGRQFAPVLPRLRFEPPNLPLHFRNPPNFVLPGEIEDEAVFLCLDQWPASPYIGLKIEDWRAAVRSSNLLAQRGTGEETEELMGIDQAIKERGRHATRLLKRLAQVSRARLSFASDSSTEKFSKNAELAYRVGWLIREFRPYHRIAQKVKVGPYVASGRTQRAQWINDFSTKCVNEPSLGLKGSSLTTKFCESMWAVRKHKSIHRAIMRHCWSVCRPHLTKDAFRQAVRRGRKELERLGQYSGPEGA